MYELQVDGMTCGGCVNGVKRSVQAVDSRAKVDVDLASKKVRVDSNAKVEAIEAAINDAGYTVVSSQVV